MRHLEKRVQDFATVGRASAGQVAELQVENVNLQGLVEESQRQGAAGKAWLSEILEDQLFFRSLSRSAMHIELSEVSCGFLA